MPITTGFRDRIRTISPGFLQEGVGEREMYALGVELDAVMERRVQGIAARLPLIRNLLSGVITPGRADALAVIGLDRIITRGLTESDLSYAIRLQRALDTWRLAGSARAELGQVLGYLLEFTPRIRSITTRYAADPAVVAWRLSQGLSGGAASYPPARVSSQWDTYEQGADTDAEPDHVFALAGANGDYDWDSLSQETGSWRWTNAYVVIYAVAPQAWTGPAPFVFGSPGVKIGERPDASIGLNVPANVIASIRSIVGLWKGAHEWVRWIIVSFSNTLFDPTQPAGGGINPDGYFGHWSRVVSGATVSTRFANARYCSGIV